MFACAGGADPADNGGYDFGTIKVDYGTDSPPMWDPGPDATRCVNENDCGGDTPFCDKSVGVCVACRGANDCLGQGYCLNGNCNGELTCQPYSRTCSKNLARTCDATGMQQNEQDCGDQVCFEGSCVACLPGAVDCPQINVARLCKLDGSGWDETQCGDLRCVNGACVACVPGQRVCQGSSIMACTLDGSGFSFEEDCDTENTGRLCHLGTCLNLCDFNAKFKTNQGCEYWATDLDQFSDPDDTVYGGGVDSPYAIVVSNINANFKATVRVTNASGFDKTYDAPPKTATIISLPPNNISGSELSNKAWHLTSTLPVVAYQFNPLENANVFSNDASLLLPTTALGKVYRVMSWPTIGSTASGQTLSSFMTIVATEEGNTDVKVTPTAAILMGVGVQTTLANTPRTWTLTKGMVLNLEASALMGDFTGSLIEATQRVAVFGGNVCADAPISKCKASRCSYDPSIACTIDSDCPGISACDHLEEQIQPLGTLGKHYVIARTMARGKAPDVIRVLAAQDGTQITASPAIVSIPVLNAGGWFEFEISDHVELTADKPFMVGHFLEGQDAPYSAHAGCYNGFTGELCETSPGSCICDNLNQNSCTKQSNCSPDDANIGDPSQMMGVPVEQFRKEYVFLVPIKYRNSYVSIVAPAGAMVLLDGVMLGTNVFQTLPSGQWMVTRLPLLAGSHTVTVDKPAGIDVYGWDFYVSYAYPGGMNVETLAVY
jgi:hypothetical protein